MRGSSAEALADLTENLGSAVQGGADAARTGDDLFAVASVLRGEAALRRTLTDPAVDAQAKSGFARDLLGEQVGGTALDLVGDAVRRRWAATRDLPDALEHLGVVAVVMAANADGHGDALEDELFGFGRLVSQNPELRDALSDPARAREDKVALLHGLLEGRVTSATLRLAEQSISGSHRTVAVAVDEYQKVVADHRDRLVATARVARELGEDGKQRLAEALERQYGRSVHLNVVVDPDVVGGVKVSVGDDVIDGTVASRLDDARRRLAG